MKTDTHRATYRALIAEAARTLGWTAAELKAEATSLAGYYQGRGESIPESWCSAAQEVITVAQEARDA